jgi:lysozyme family protein
MTFARAVAHVLKMEGGLVDNPTDPGGLTQYGISQRAYPQLDIRNLTQAQAAELYHSDYWEKIHGDELPDEVSFALLDYAVNSGVGGAIRGLQRAIGAQVDGTMGSQTLRLARVPTAVVPALSTERILMLAKLPTFEYFGKGWLARVISTAIEAFG